MRIVVDSNIFISALISDKGAPHTIFKAWQNGRFEVITCLDQLEELRRASHYPKFRSLIPPHVFGSLLNHLQRATVFDDFPAKHEATDADDAYLLNLASASAAHYLITGDKRSGLLAKRRVGQAKILTASTFLRTVLSL